MSGHLTARVALAEAATTYMRTNLRLEPPAEAVALLRGDPDARLVEFAHTPHFGHLGFLRMLLTAGHLALERPDRVVVFFVNDHVRANAFRFIRQIPMDRAGAPMKALPGLGVPGAKASMPLRYVPAPSAEALSRARQLVLQVLLYEASEGGAGPSEVKRAVNGLFDWLEAQAGVVDVFSEWAARCLLLLLEEVWGPNRSVLVVPSTSLSAIFPEQLSTAVERSSDLARIQNELGQADGAWPAWSAVKEAPGDFLPFHVLCPSCGEVASTSVGPDGRVSVTCHGDTWALDSYDDVAPKVVLRQPLADLLDLELRVCGNPLGYWEVADTISTQVFGHAPTDRHRVTGYVRFRGLGGDDAEPAMLRVLAEMGAPDVAAQILGGEPHEDIVVTSPLPADAHAR